MKRRYERISKQKTGRLAGRWVYRRYGSYGLEAVVDFATGAEALAWYDRRNTPASLARWFADGGR